jgi:hypothetical protein
MIEQLPSQNTPCRKFLHELEREIEHPLQRRLIQAYQGDDPVQSMESELRKILLEVLHRED